METKREKLERLNAWLINAHETLRAMETSRYRERYHDEIQSLSNEIISIQCVVNRINKGEFYLL